MTEPAQDSILTKFVGRKPRETAGSSSANRFEYQKDWTLYKLLELHRSDDAYLIICDYHEDVVQFDSHSIPKNAVFYQIKTKSSNNWTRKSLTKSQKGKNVNIVFNYCWMGITQKIFLHLAISIDSNEIV